MSFWTRLVSSIASCVGFKADSNVGCLDDSSVVHFVVSSIAFCNGFEVDPFVGRGVVNCVGSNVNNKCGRAKEMPNKMKVITASTDEKRVGFRV